MKEKIFGENKMSDRECGLEVGEIITVPGVLPEGELGVVCGFEFPVSHWMVRFFVFGKEGEFIGTFLLTIEGREFKKLGHVWDDNFNFLLKERKE